MAKSSIRRALTSSSQSVIPNIPGKPQIAMIAADAEALAQRVRPLITVDGRQAAPYFDPAHHHAVMAEGHRSRSRRLLEFDHSVGNGLVIDPTRDRPVIGKREVGRSWAEH